MKNFIFLVSVLFLVPAFASASQVQVYPTFTSVGFHGDLKSSKDTTVCIQRGDGSQECRTSTPTFDTPTGASYQILFTPPMGYSYTADSNCQSDAAPDGLSVCHVDYTASNALWDQQLKAALQVTQSQEVQAVPPPASEPAPASQPDAAPAPANPSPAPASQPAQPTGFQLLPPSGKEPNGLTCSQANSILLVLSAFGVSSSIVSHIADILEPLPCA